MRTGSTQGMSGDVYRFIYPNDNIWLKDNNIIKVENLAETRFGVRVTLYNNISGETKSMAYRTDLKEIIFDLNSTLYTMYFDAGVNDIDITVECFRGDILTVDGQFSFTTTLLNGKSYTSESHSCERVIYVYSESDLEHLELFFEASGEITMGSFFNEVPKGFTWIDLSETITSEGTYILHYENAAARPTVEIAGIQVGTNSAVVTLSVSDNSGTLPADAKRGGVWVNGEFVADKYDIQIVYEPICEDFDILRFDYTNADGCERHLAGKLIEEVNEASFNDYEHYTDSVYKNIPYHLQTGASQTVKVGFTDINKFSYWNHILDSEMVYFTNYEYEKHPCILKTNKITKTTDESQDFELEITLIKN